MISQHFFNIIQNFGDQWKATTRRSTTTSTVGSVKQERICKSERSNVEQSEYVCHERWRFTLHSLAYNYTYRIAGNFRWVQIFTIFVDRPASAKIKTTKKCTKMEIVTSLRAYVDTN